MKLPVCKKYAGGGFTLLEVLVAVFLASIVIIALYTVFFSVLRGRSDIDRTLERTREVSRFLDIFSREIQSSFFKSSNPKTFFVGDEDDKSGKSVSKLYLTAFTYPKTNTDTNTGDLLSIRYYAEENDGKLTLYKETWNSYGDETDGGFKAEVVEDIEGFEILYYNGKDWAKAWDARLDNTLPEAVKATLSVMDKGEVKEFSVMAQPMIR